MHTKLHNHAPLSITITLLLIVLVLSLLGCQANDNSAATPTDSSTSSVDGSGDEYTNKELGTTDSDGKKDAIGTSPMENSLRIKDDLKKKLEDIAEKESSEHEAMQEESSEIDALP